MKTRLHRKLRTLAIILAALAVPAWVAAGNRLTEQVPQDSNGPQAEGILDALLNLQGDPAADLSAVDTSVTGSGFTYQGQLKQSGQPVNGNVNAVFRLYDDPSAGT